MSRCWCEDDVGAFVKRSLSLFHDDDLNYSIFVPEIRIRKRKSKSTKFALCFFRTGADAHTLLETNSTSTAQISAMLLWDALVYNTPRRLLNTHP